MLQGSLCGKRHDEFVCIANIAPAFPRRRRASGVPAGLGGQARGAGIGNSAYQNAPPLPNPVNDGAAIATTLRGAGFDIVDSRHDLTAIEMRRALRDFSDIARDADIAVVYYAGHGIEVDGTTI